MSSSSSSEAVEKPPTLGLVAGKYELVRVIGRGGMGSVWEARHVSLGTRVAIKFVDVDEAKSEEAKARFQTEARAAATIQSRHAIKVYDHGILEEGRPYIVMELLVGEPLDRRLKLLRRLLLADTARIVLQVARALQQAHDAGITHRDLKPENIFLEQSPDDDEETAKVLDFGIAKIRDPARVLGLSSTTKTGVLMGTPYFMSPEQVREPKTVDHRSDLWALAVVVFRCVTGALPFKSESLGDLLVKILHGPHPGPLERAPRPVAPARRVDAQGARPRSGRALPVRPRDGAGARGGRRDCRPRAEPTRRRGERGSGVGLGRAVRGAVGRVRGGAHRDVTPAVGGPHEPRRVPGAHSRGDLVPSHGERPLASSAARRRRQRRSRRGSRGVRARGRGGGALARPQDHSCHHDGADPRVPCPARPTAVRLVLDAIHGRRDGARHSRAFRVRERFRTPQRCDHRTSTGPALASRTTPRGCNEAACCGAAPIDPSSRSPAPGSRPGILSTTPTLAPKKRPGTLS